MKITQSQRHLRSEDTIEGDGDLFMLGNDLLIKYRISYTIPYDYPHKHEKGEVVLISE